jgi:CBS domain-containing protein
MLHVRDLMQRQVATLDVDDTLDLPEDVMHLGRARHFPVTSKGKVVGVLSQRDLYHAAVSSILQQRCGTSRSSSARVLVKAAMSTALHTIGPDRPLRDAVNMMLREQIGCLPVIEDGQLMGLLSETDCLRHLAGILALDEHHPPRDVPL